MPPLSVRQWVFHAAAGPLSPWSARWRCGTFFLEQGLEVLLIAVQRVEHILVESFLQGCFQF